MGPGAIVTRLNRGDGVGIELTQGIARGVLFAADEPGRLRAAAEVGIRQLDDDRAVLDALVRLRAELGGTIAPTRLALFPAGSTLHRLDVTAMTGPELNATRHRVAQVDAVSSTVLIDDGPRRWLYAVRWDDNFVRRIEELVERAGFVDVAVDPSPIALSRVLPSRTVFARRDAAPGASFDVVLAGLPIAATATDAIGRHPPDLAVSTAPVSVGILDGLTDAADIAIQVQVAADASDLGAEADVLALELDGPTHPAFPPHDLRAASRQCVALGAALGAAGLAGRLRPIDMMLTTASATPAERPWAIERMSTLPATPAPKPVGSTKRFAARLVPRRKR